ncbi:hypothetical protein OOT08_14440 [Leucobacter sp. M11]|nr:hypothetical protein [Leucobacter sp. M11]
MGRHRPVPRPDRAHRCAARAPAQPGRRGPSMTVAEFVAAGATALESHGTPGAAWTVLADPDGNRFCIGDPH